MAQQMLGPLPTIGPTAGQSPTLIPQFSRPAASKLGLIQQSPAAYLAANPQTAATATVTVGGTPTASDNASITISHPIFKNPALAAQLNISGGAVTVTYEQVAGDSIESVAEGLATLINESALGAFLLAEASEAVITLSWLGPVGNFAGLSVSATGVTLTASGSSLSGGAGPVRVWQNFNWAAGGSMMSFMAGNLYNMSGVLAGVVNGAQPVM